MALELSPVAGVLFFRSRFFFFFLRYSLFLSVWEVFPGSVDLERGRAGALPSVCFTSFGLDSLVRGSLVVVP